MCLPVCPFDILMQILKFKVVQSKNVKFYPISTHFLAAQ